MGSDAENLYAGKMRTCARLGSAFPSAETNLSAGNVACAISRFNEEHVPRYRGVRHRVALGDVCGLPTSSHSMATPTV